MYVVGLDIGGANIKSADCDSAAKSISFDLWKTPELLKQCLQELLSSYRRPDFVAVTMTGELADCFQTKAVGVDQILSAVEHAVTPVPVVVWQTGAEFLDIETAREFPLLVAAANWHGLATWLARMISNQSGILLDIGSTTTDIIPLQNGIPVPEGLTDVERLLSGELVYTGGRRTPVAMIGKSVTLQGQQYPLAAEIFATALDLYLLLEERAQNPSDLNTANGKPATLEDAYDRITRSVCCDRSEITMPEAIEMAAYLAKQQQKQISQAIDQVLDQMIVQPEVVLISGSAVFLAEKIVRRHPVLSHLTMINVAEIFDGPICDAACAFAIARLAAERIQI